MGRVIHTIVESATCDACGATIPVDPPCSPHHGILRSEFGYGSPLDHVGGTQCVLCEACWRKACAALGLDPSTLTNTGVTPGRSQPYCTWCGQATIDHDATPCTGPER